MSALDLDRPRSTLLPPPSDEAYDYMTLVLERALARDAEESVLLDPRGDVPTMLLDLAV